MTSHNGRPPRVVEPVCSARVVPEARANLRVLMDVAESPELDPHSPEDEEQPALSDDDILRESGSEQDLDGAGERASDLEDEENATRVQSQEETHSDEEDRASEPKSQDQDSEAHELSRGPAGSLCEEGDDVEEDRTSDLRDEASSVTRELDEHELDYDEEVPEEPAPAAQEEEAEKAGAEDEEEKGEGAPGEEGKPDIQSVGEKEPTEAAKEKKKEDDDGEIDDGEIDDDDLEEGEVKDPSDRKGGPVVDEILPPPPPEPPTESAWERGLRHAKEVLKKATIRKEQEPDFEEKRFTVTIGEDDREFDKENEVFRDWNSRVPRDVRDTT
ncbi:hypothetical protein A6R68_16415 [Neotoma lepida]|uniref:Uncharacterized protein n=1 Tax=Neotoma lepida TaxID=56216 RepID=A0A1A6HHI6_NEOLE|nr:hypothetical protein A6R68_16415 [Neotoma lepida]